MPDSIAPTALERRLGPLVAREGGGPPGWPETLASFLRQLLERNAHVNLVSRRSSDRVVEDHVLPSLAVLRIVPAEAPVHVLDIGTGGGFPGIPLKILRPAVRLDLLEATRKKCEFLREAVAGLGLADVEVHWGRVEEPPESLLTRAPFEIATARAVGHHDRLARRTRPLLGANGRLWVFVPPEDPGRVEVWTDESGRPITALRPYGAGGATARP